MSRLTISPIVRAFKLTTNVNGYVGVFGQLACGYYHKEDESSYRHTQYDGPILVESCTPLEFGGEKVARIIIKKQYNAIRALVLPTEWVWLDEHDNVVGRTPYPSDYRGFSCEITADEKFLICRNRVYCDSFDNYCDMRDVIAGAYVHGVFLAFSPSTLLDVVNKKIIWVLSACVVIDGGKYTGNVIEHLSENKIFILKVDNQSGQKSSMYADIKPRKIKHKRSACVICMEKPQKYIMTYGCGHSSVCESCHEKIKPINGHKQCPECQQVISVMIPTMIK